jgi:hypothetical protein
MFNELMIDLQLNNIKNIENNNLSFDTKKIQNFEKKDIKLNEFSKNENFSSAANTLFSKNEVYNINKNEVDSIYNSNNYKFNTLMTVSVASEALINSNLIGDLKNLEKPEFKNDANSLVNENTIKTIIKSDVLKNSFNTYSKNENVNQKIMKNNFDLLSQNDLLKDIKVDLTNNNKINDKNQIQVLTLSFNKELSSVLNDKSIVASALTKGMMENATASAQGTMTNQNLINQQRTDSLSGGSNIVGCHSNCHSNCHGSRGWR